MKTYYKSFFSKTIVEVKDSSARMGTVVYDLSGEYVVGREYEFLPFSEKAIWTECSVQDIPCSVSLIKVSNLIQSQEFLDWFDSDACRNSGETFIFLRKMLDAE